MLTACRNFRSKNYSPCTTACTPPRWKRCTQSCSKTGFGEVFLAQDDPASKRRQRSRTWLATPAEGGGRVDVAGKCIRCMSCAWLLGDCGAGVSCLFGDPQSRRYGPPKTHAVVLLKFASGIAAEMTCTFGIAQRTS